MCFDRLRYYIVFFIGLLISHGTLSQERSRFAFNEELQSAEKLISSALKDSQSEKSQAEKVAEAAQKRLTDERLKEAQKLVREVKQKEFSLEDFGLIATSKDKIATKDGVNIGNLLSRYRAKDFPKEASNNLPGLMVFISLGMPDNSLRQLADQVRRVGGTLVLRGIYQKSLQGTIKAVHELNKRGAKTVIHPKLFKKYKIEAVPVFVLENDRKCRADRCTNFYDRLAGNVTLEYALTQFHESGSNKDVAKKYMERMRVKE